MEYHFTTYVYTERFSITELCDTVFANHVIRLIEAIVLNK